MKGGPDEPGIGRRFQDETKYRPETLGEHRLNWDALPPPYKNYEDAIARVALPEPETRGNPDIWKALQKRRSRRDYRAGEKLPLVILSALLWATQGATARRGDTLFRTAPSAGGLYPTETYLSARAVSGLEPGFYHFRPQAFDLEYLKKGDYSRELAHGALDQMIVAHAQVTFVWSAILERGRWKYRQRAYRYIYLDAGHIAQNLYLAAEALELGVCAVGAFYDDVINGLFGFDGAEETVTYLASVGIPAELPSR
jgi:SagB-type dehydrogenase family enzyme